MELDVYAVRGVPAICWRDDAPILFERLQLRENTDYFIDVTLPVPKAEAVRLSRQRPAWPFSERLRTVFRLDPPRRWKEPGAGSVTVSGQLRLRNHAGILDLGMENGASLRAEVVCRKIGYLDEFRALLNEVAELLAELLLQYDSPVSLAFDLTDARDASLAALLFQMRYVMAPDNLPLAAEEVLSQVHSMLVTDVGFHGIAEVEEASVETLAEALDVSLFEAGGPLAGLFGGYTPLELPVTEVAEIIDTPENRYVKYFLEEAALLAQWLTGRLGAVWKRGGGAGSGKLGPGVAGVARTRHLAGRRFHAAVPLEFAGAAEASRIPRRAALRSGAAPQPRAAMEPG